VCQRVRRPGCEAGHLHPHSAKIKDEWIYISATRMACQTEKFIFRLDHFLFKLKSQPSSSMRSFSLRFIIIIIIIIIIYCN
jgi:hypothetical protein